MNFALFMQTTKEHINEKIYIKILTSEFWATIEWMFAIPANRIGNIFLNPAQLAISSYIFDFLALLWSNRFWLQIPTTIDDYTSMIFIFIGMVISQFKLLN